MNNSNPSMSNLDTNQMFHRTLDESLDAQRVTLVGQELNIDSAQIANAVKEGLKSISFSIPEQKTIVDESSIKIEKIEIPVIVTETKIERIEIPVIVKEIQILTVEKPIIITELKIIEIEKPIITKEIQTIEVQKFDKITKILLILNALMLIVQLLKN